MKKILLLFAILGVALSTCSCGSFLYDVSGYRIDPPTTGYTQVYYQQGDQARNGTIIKGSRRHPTGFYWQNLSIERRGMVVAIFDESGRMIKSYDLRIPGQYVDDYYNAVGRNGQALEVNVFIRGGSGSINYLTVSSGRFKETYSLRRD